VIPLPRCQSQAAGNVLSMGKKAKLQNHEYVGMKMLESVPDTFNRADQSNPMSSNQFGCVMSRKFAFALPENMFQFDHPDLLNDKFLFGTKFSEHGQNLPDWGDDRETLSTSSQSHFHPQFRKNIWVDIPRPEPSGTFSQPSENEIELMNHGLSPAKLKYNLHHSMMPGPSRPDVTGISHNNPNNIDIAKKKNERKLVFNSELFKGADEFQEQRNYMAKILDSIPKPFEGNFMLSMEQLYIASAKINCTHPKLYSSLTNIKMRKMSQFKFIWHQYWKDEDKIDFSKSKNYPILKNIDFDQDVLHIYLILVKEILFILPFKKNQQSDKGLDYPLEMQKAFQSYLDFKKLIGEHRLNRSKPFNDRVNSVLCSIKKSNRKNAIIWKFVEVWMEKEYIDVWNSVRDFSGRSVCKNIKSIFSAIFTYGIENMNHQINIH
jgi:hypothetical protein